MSRKKWSFFFLWYALCVLLIFPLSPFLFPSCPFPLILLYALLVTFLPHRPMWIVVVVCRHAYDRGVQLPQAPACACGAQGERDKEREKERERDKERRRFSKRKGINIKRQKGEREERREGERECGIKRKRVLQKQTKKKTPFFKKIYVCVCAYAFTLPLPAPSLFFPRLLACRM